MGDSIDAFSNELYEKARIKHNKKLISVILPNYTCAKIFTYEQIKHSRMLSPTELDNIIPHVGILSSFLEGRIPPNIETVNIELKQGGREFVKQNYNWLKQQIKISQPVTYYIDLSEYTLEGSLARYLPWMGLYKQKENIALKNIQGAFYTQNYCVYFKFPVKTSFVNGKLHNPKDGAIEFENKTKLYFLNNVSVPEELVMTDEDKIDIVDFVKKYKNVEVRRELLRKVGLDRFVSKTKAEIIDSWLGYDLLKLHIPNMRTNPVVLKMKNPSIDCYHVEGVPSYIKKVQEALS